MLENTPWIAFAPELEVEWKQCLDEGLEVADCEEVCRQAAKLPGFPLSAAEDLARVLHGRPIRTDFPFEEPDDLPAILEKRPANRPLLPAVKQEELPDRIRGAWQGRIAGCLLGKPVEGFYRDRLVALLRGTGNYPLERYMARGDMTDELIKRLSIDPNGCWADTLDGRSPADDDTNYTVLALKLVETYGRHFRPNDVLEGWLRWLPMLSACTAERVAYRNAAAGMTAPETARHDNPYREWIGAQIRGDFFGYLNPGKPEEAASMAWRDASISHVKNGIYGEMYAAALIAAAAVCTDMEAVVQAGLGQIPVRCRLRQGIERVCGWYKEGLNAEAILDRIHHLYDERQMHHWCHTIPNAMIVTTALLGGGGDFGKSICLAVQAAFDTDCTGATVGSILGMFRGAQGIEARWTAPFRDGLNTAIEGFPLVTPEQLTARTLAIIGG